MRKFATALAAVGFVLGVAAPAMAQSKAKSSGPVAAAPAKKKLVKKAAPRSTVARYQRKCKPGQVWNAEASLSAGACERRAAKRGKAVKSKVIARAPRAVVKSRKT